MIPQYRIFNYSIMITDEVLGHATDIECNVDRFSIEISLMGSL